MRTSFRTTRMFVAATVLVVVGFTAHADAQRRFGGMGARGGMRAGGGFGGGGMRTPRPSPRPSPRPAPQPSRPAVRDRPSQPSPALPDRPTTLPDRPGERPGLPGERPDRPARPDRPDRWPDRPRPQPPDYWYPERIWALPPVYHPGSLYGVNCYWVSDLCYEPVMEEGDVVYVEVYQDASAADTTATDTLLPDTVRIPPPTSR